MKKKLMIATLFVSLFGIEAFGLFGRRYRDDYYQDEPSLTERAAMTVAEKADEVAGAAKKARVRAQNKRAYADERAEQLRREREDNRRVGEQERRNYQRGR
jgi:hypothetical protein